MVARSTPVNGALRAGSVVAEAQESPRFKIAFRIVEYLGSKKKIALASVRGFSECPEHRRLIHTLGLAAFFFFS